jgi:hypothetical protein
MKKMNKKTKIIIGVVAGIAVIGTTIFLVRRNRKRKNEEMTRGGDFSDDFEALQTTETADEIRQRLRAEASADPAEWKARGALDKGYDILPEYIKKYDIPDIRILEWMYHIKEESSWGKNLTGEDLYEAAQYQAAKAKGLAS